eukprot:XP_011669515.1 PREDICTED: uncharacterized protein LOC100890715 isoform X2 [Strongylocentrotus purpuratus]
MPNKRRKRPEDLAREYCEQGTDPNGFEKRHINDVIGYGLFATRSFSKGDFLLEYRGIRSCVDDHNDEGTREPEPYVFYYDYMGKTYRIDAWDPDSGLARYINDEWRHPNAVVKKVVRDTTVHLCLFALEDVKAGEELRYNYGVDDLPWRKQVHNCSTCSQVYATLEQFEIHALYCVPVQAPQCNVQTPPEDEQYCPTVVEMDDKIQTPPEDEQHCPTVVEMDGKIQTPPEDEQYCQTVVETDDKVQTPPEDKQCCPTVVEMDDKIQTPPEDEQHCPTVVEMDGKIQTPPEDEQYCQTVVETDDKVQTPPEDKQCCPTVVEMDDKIQTPPEDEQYCPTVVEMDDKIQTPPEDEQHCPTVVEMDGKIQTPPEDEQYCQTVVETDDKVQTPPEDKQCCPTVVETDDKIQTPPEDKQYRPTVETDAKIQTPPEYEQYCPTVVETDDKVQTLPEDEQCCPTVVETDDKIQTPPEDEQYRPTVVETDDKVQTLPEEQCCPTDVETDDKIQTPPEDEQYCPTVVETDADYCPSEYEQDSPTVVETDADYCPSEDEHQSVDGNDVFYPTVKRSKEGKRVYNKHQACYYCGQLKTKISKHLLVCHCDETEVAHIAALPRNSKERQIEFELLRNKGNYYHNIKVLNTSEGELILVRRPGDKDIFDQEDYGPCPYCLGFFKRNDLWKHTKYLCHGKDCEETTISAGQIKLESDLLLDKGSGASAYVKEVLATMKDDDITMIVKNDPLIIQLGNREGRKCTGVDSQKRKHYVSQEMRRVGRLLQNLRMLDHNGQSTLDQFIKPKNFDRFIEAVQITAGSGESKESSPSLALRLGNVISKAAMIKKCMALRMYDDNPTSSKEREQEAKNFMTLKNAEWAEKVSCEALNTMAKRKYEKVVELPLSDDLKKFSEFLQQEIEACEDLTDPTTYRRCETLVLARLTTFNKRRGGEMEQLKLKSYTERPNWNAVGSGIEEVKKSLSPLEQHLMNDLDMVYTRGKRGRKVPVLIPQDCKATMDKLVAHRHEGGITKDNVYFFARPGCETSLRASDSLQALAEEADLMKPHLIRTTKMRKYCGTVSQILNLSESQLDWLADHMGHDIRVHREFYRLNESTIELAKVAKLMIAIDEGKAGKLIGKNLDEITEGDIDIQDLLQEQQEPTDVPEKCGNIPESEQRKSEMPRDMQVGQLCKRSALKIRDQSSVSQQKQRKSRCMVKDIPEFEDSSPESDAQSKQKKRKKTERSEYVPESEYSSPESDAEPKQMKRKKTKSSSRDVLESEYSSPESDAHPKQKKRTKTKKSKGNRRPWSKEETRAVWKYFHQDIKKGNTPGKILCMRCIQQNEVLKERSWRDVKYKVRNSVVSMRNSRK